MSNRRTEIQHQSKDGDHFQVTAQETDSPVLPVAQLKNLHEFRPDLVDWVLARTDEEAKHRRVRQRRVDLYVFIERISGLVGGVVIAAFGLAAAAYLAMFGHEITAGIIGGGTLVGIVSVLVTGRKQPPQKQPEPATQQGKKNR